MKKTLLLFIIFSLQFYAQTGTNSYGLNNYADIPKYKCKTGHKCDVKYHIDDFNDRIEYKTENFNASRMSYTGGSKPLTVSFTKFVEKNGTTNIYAFFSGNVEGCITKEASVIILLKNGDKVVLPNMSSKIDCGRDFIIVNVSNENALALLDGELLKARLLYDDNSEDFEFNEKGIFKFKEKLKCIIEL